VKFLICIAQKVENRPLIGLIGLIGSDLKNQENQSHQPNQWSILHIYCAKKSFTVAMKA